MNSDSFCHWYCYKNCCFCTIVTNLIMSWLMRSIRKVLFLLTLGSDSATLWFHIFWIEFMSLGRSPSPSPSPWPQWRNNGVCEQVILSASTIVATNSHKQQNNTKKKMEWMELQKVLSKDALHWQHDHDHYRHHHHHLQNHQEGDWKVKICKKYWIGSSSTSLSWLQNMEHHQENQLRFFAKKCRE